MRINKSIQQTTHGEYELKEATLFRLRRLENAEMIESYWETRTTGARRLLPYHAARAGDVREEQGKLGTHEKTHRSFDMKRYLEGIIMEENLRQYVERLFADAQKPGKCWAAGRNLYEFEGKSTTTSENGASEEEAYEIVKSSIGDVDELISSANDLCGTRTFEKERRQRAGLTAVAVMLYILAPVFIIVLGKHEPADSRPHVHVYPDRGSNGPARVPQLAASGLSV